jgi:hypothetical protein
MVVSWHDDGQCTCNRRGARNPQAAAGGEAYSGTPEREATSSAGKGGVMLGARAIGWPNRPSRDLHPQVTSERLPYCILRRMSTDVSQA